MEGSSGAGPRVLPPWLQAQTPTSGSHSVTQDSREDFSDVKSTEPGDKKLSEVCTEADLNRDERFLHCEPGGDEVRYWGLDCYQIVTSSVPELNGGKGFTSNWRLMQCRLCC